MVTTRDLVEAHAFTRRRLVAAFLTGVADGREVEPAPPGRTVVAGLAMGVLLVAGAVVASVVAPRSPADWDHVGLVVSRGDRPAPYVVLEASESPVLVPVVNLASAQLVLGADVAATWVDEEVVERQPQAEPIGILGAPQALPGPDRLLGDGWTACTGEGAGTSVHVTRDPPAAAPGTAALLVESAGQQWLLATSGTEDPAPSTFRYPVPSDTGDQLLVGFGFGQRSDAISVPADWLALFPEGGELGPGGLGLPDLGEPLSAPPAPGARVGDYAVSASGQAGVFTSSGVQPLDDFALAVLRGSAHPHGAPALLDVPLPATYTDVTYDRSRWPTSAVEPLRAAPCVRLDAAPQRPPHVRLAGTDGLGSGVPEGVPVGERRVSVDAGHGAFVFSGGWDQTTSGSAYVVAASGTAHPLVGGAQTLETLGYDVATAPLVPAEWLAVLDEGVPLSTSAALCPPAAAHDEPAPQDCPAPG